MARIRTIKPEYACDGKIRRLSDSTALFFILLWNHCDDDGYFPYDSWELAMKTVRWRAQEVGKFLSSLHGAKLVRLSSTVGVGLVEGWRHQWVSKKQTSKWKGKEIQWDAAPQSLERSWNVPIPKGKERKGKDTYPQTENEDLKIPAPSELSEHVEISKKKAPKTTGYSQEFENLYEPYPRKEGKSKGYKIFQKIPESERPKLKVAIDNFVKRNRGKESQYIKHFSTFMNEWMDWVDPNHGSCAFEEKNPATDFTGMEDMAPAESAGQFE